VFQVQKIESLDLPELQPYRTMRRQQEHRDAGTFVAEGEKVVRRLLDSQLEVISVLLPEKWLAELTPQIEARPESVRVFVAEKKLLERLTGFSMYQGLLALAKVPAQPTLAELVERAPRPWLFTALDGLSSAENIGSLIRNCAGFGAHGLIVGETSPSPFLRRSVRSSMGTIFELPIVECTNLKESLGFLKGKSVRVIAAHPHTDQRTIEGGSFAGDVCIVFGSEGYGISPAILAVCDEARAIAMPPNIDSLNVSSAAAVFLYEATRQRGQVSRADRDHITAPASDRNVEERQD
jgi:tRNA G18 (ribose-2'-O)-methylase SpoU